MIVLFLSTLLVAATQMPLLMVVLRSVREEEKAFALGIQFVIFRLFGYIPRFCFSLSLISNNFLQRPILMLLFGLQSNHLWARGGLHLPLVEGDLQRC